MNYRLLAGNALTAFAAQGVSIAVSVIMTLLVPKVLGVAAYGYWQLFVFYASYSGFFHFGLNDGVYLVEGGKTRDEVDKTFINSQFFVGAVFQLLIGFGMALMGCFWATEPERSFVLISFAVYMVMNNTSAFFGYLFQAMNETKLYSYMVVVERLAFLGPLLLLVFWGADSFTFYVYAYLVAKALALLYCFWHARDFVFTGLVPLTAAARAAVLSIRIGFGLMLANVAASLILGVARALVDYAWGIEAFGRVSFALSVVGFFLSFVAQAAMVLFPALRQGTDMERRSFYRGVRDVLGIIAPGVYLLYFPVAWLLSMWLPQYAESMRYFAILLPMCAFNAKMDICGNTYFKVLRKEKLLLAINLVAVMGSALVSVIGIYVFGSLDVVLIGVVACIVCRSLWSEWYLNRRLDVCPTPLVCEEVLLTVSFVSLSLLYPATVAIIAYAALYCVYLAVNHETTGRLVSAVRRKSKQI